MKTSTRAPEARVPDLVRTADLAVRRRAEVRRWFAERLHPAERRLLRAIGREADAGGQRAFLVGGMVRDLVLGREVRDMDVAVEGDERALGRRLGGRLHVHRGFPTATLQFDDGIVLDLAATRTERYDRPAALPQVTRAGLAEDLARRDFAMHALAIPLGRSGPQGLIDPFGGLADLRAGWVRVLHRRSFLDDPTRALRAVRYAAELRFTIEPNTAMLIRDAVARDAFRGLSGQRLARELQRILADRRAGEGLRLLARLRLLEPLSPELQPNRLTLRGLGRVRSTLAWYRARAPEIDLPAWVPALSILLRPAGEPTARGVVERLQLSAADRRAVLDGVLALRGLPRRLAAARRPSTVRRICGPYDEPALLAVLAAPGSERVARAVRRYLTVLRHVNSELGGADLLAGGISPGPAIARGLRAALDARLDGRAPTREEQLRVALRAARRS